MRIKLPVSIGITRQFTSKVSGKQLNTVKLNFLGGHFEVFIPEEFIPDMIENRQVSADLDLTSDAQGKPQLRLIGVSEPLAA